MPQVAPALEEAKARLVKQAPALQGDLCLGFAEKPGKSLQRDLVSEIQATNKRHVLSAITLRQRGRIRRGGGPGAGAFLVAPVAGNAPMADGPWRIAVRKRLLCTIDCIVSPAHADTHCLHSNSKGACGAHVGATRV